MKSIGIVVTVVYVSVVGAAGFVLGHQSDLLDVGMGQPTINLVSGALLAISSAIATIAMTVGLVLPSIRGENIVNRSAAPKEPPNE